MKHTVYFKAAQNMNLLGDNTIDIVVTSPPYPMIEMWDEIMSSQNYEIKKHLKRIRCRHRIFIWGKIMIQTITISVKREFDR